MVITPSGLNISIIDDDGFQPSIKIDSNNHPHISYTCDNGKQLRYAYFDGSAWQIDILETGTIIFALCYPSIDVDTQNRPHILYANDEFTQLKYAYHNGSTWVFEVVANVYINLNGISMQLSSSNQPNIAYSCRDDSYPGGQRYQLRYAIRSGGIWDTTIFSINANPTDMYASLALDTAQRPHISYMHLFNSDSGLLYLFNNGVSWQTEVVDYTESSWTGYWSQIDLGNNNIPQISYGDGDTHGLKYTSKLSGTWQTTIIDQDGYCGTYNDIAVDNNNRPHVGYNWENSTVPTARALRYAYYGPSTMMQKPQPTNHPTKESLIISAIYPQPAHSFVNCRFDLTQPGEVILQLFDLAGRLVQSKELHCQAGETTVAIDVSSLANGLYLLKAEIPTCFAQKRVLLVK